MVLCEGVQAEHAQYLCDAKLRLAVWTAHTHTASHSVTKVHVYQIVLVQQDFCANYDNGEEPAAGGDRTKHTHTHTL